MHLVSREKRNSHIHCAHFLYEKPYLIFAATLTQRCWKLCMLLMDEFRCNATTKNLTWNEASTKFNYCSENILIISLVQQDNFSIIIDHTSDSKVRNSNRNLRYRGTNIVASSWNLPEKVSIRSGVYDLFDAMSWNRNIDVPLFSSRNWIWNCWKPSERIEAWFIVKQLHPAFFESLSC